MTVTHISETECSMLVCADDAMVPALNDASPAFLEDLQQINGAEFVGKTFYASRFFCKNYPIINLFESAMRIVLCRPYML